MIVLLRFKSYMCLRVVGDSHSDRLVAVYSTALYVETGSSTSQQKHNCHR